VCRKGKNYNLIQKKKRGQEERKEKRKREKEKREKRKEKREKRKEKREKREKSYRYYLVLSDNLNIERLRFGFGYHLILKYYLGIL
jgi:hypothetical protein